MPKELFITNNTFIGRIKSIENITILPLASTTITIADTDIKADSIILSSIREFSGTGVPTIHTNNVLNNGFNIIIYNLHATETITHTIQINYVIY